MKKTNDAVTSHVSVTPMQFGIFIVWYQNEIMDAGMPKLALVSSTYVNAQL
jgi:hypothetical protein